MIHKAKSNSAVSPVIGTILLVAIAVVLALIILAVVMGFSGDPNEKKVGLNAKPQSGNNATLILYGGASVDELISLRMIDHDSPIGEYVEFWNITNDSAYIGVPYLAKDVAKPLQSMEIYDTRINVLGTFTDGTEVVLLIQPMTFHDVEGSNSNKEPVINSNVNPPSITSQKMVENLGVNVTATVTHTGLSSKPVSGKIYYQSIDGKISGSVDAKISGTAASGSMTATLPGLLQNTSYTVWGVFESDTETFKGSSNTFDAMKTTATFTGIRQRFSDANMYINSRISYLDKVPNTCRVMVQKEGEKAYVAMTYAITESNYNYNVQAISPYGDLTLKPYDADAYYDMWIEVDLLNGQSFEGTKRTFRPRDIPDFSGNPREI